MENIFSTAARKAVNFPRDSDPYVPLSNRFVYPKRDQKFRVFYDEPPRHQPTCVFHDSR